MDTILDTFIGSASSVADPEFIARVIIFSIAVEFIGLMFEYIGKLR